jgi:biotin-dependent carboxylase-like uncharacterized protein
MSGSAPALEVVEPGMLLTVQDLGRHGFEHLGVPRAGAADTGSLALANRLAGTEASAAALEATLLGPTLRILGDVTIGLAGADLAPVALPGGRPLPVGRSHRLRAGEILECTEAGDAERGCRLYIAVPGGIDVPVVLGSRSTSLVGAFGGHRGRSLRAGDVLAAFDPGKGRGSADATPDTGTAADAGTAPDTGWTLAPPARSGEIRVLPGPAARETGGEERLAALLATAWSVSVNSDRRGLRLDHDDTASNDLAMPGDRPSFGVVPGAIQLTPSGQPIVLMPDGGVTGGYPVIAVVVRADQPRLGQLVPGAPLRFVRRDRHPSVIVRT